MFVPIPENTIRAARASYGRGNVYLRLGDQLNELLSKIDSDLLSLRSDGYAGPLLAVLTLIQYVEGLTDVEFTESLHGRVDLRYALHLPTPGPRFDPFTLCAFRQRALKDHQYYLLLTEIFKVVYPELGPEEFHNDLKICEIVKSICEDTMRASVVEAMFHAIEALSANHFTWLRQVALPHWYERYNNSLLMVGSGRSIRQKEYTPDDLRDDIEHLLNAAGQVEAKQINTVPEVKTLRRMWDQLLHYQPEDPCSYCSNKSFERRTSFNPTRKKSL